MTNPNGGPAYPCGPSGGCGPWDGMTLRDYFAAKAMQALVATDWPHEQAAKVAWDIAAEMLAARQEVGQ